jgi:excinuclease ABC subunit A
MTELTDFFKVWFSHVAECYDPATGEKVEDDTPQRSGTKPRRPPRVRTVIVAFRITKPDNLTWPEILTNLKNQGLRPPPCPRGARPPPVAISPSTHRRPPRPPAARKAHPLMLRHPGPRRRDRGETNPASSKRSRPPSTSAKTRCILFDASGPSTSPGLTLVGHYSRGLHSPSRPAAPSAPRPPRSSRSTPRSAPVPNAAASAASSTSTTASRCPTNRSRSTPAPSSAGRAKSTANPRRTSRLRPPKKKIPTNVRSPRSLPSSSSFVIDGEPGYGEENGKTWPKYWYGVKGFFRWLEKNTYKMHVRVFLSRYRAYNPCPDCGGQRLQPEALCWKWQGRTLPELYQLPVSDSSAPPRRRPTGGSTALRRRRPQRLARLRIHPHAPALPRPGRPRLPHPRPPVEDPLRRRGPARQPHLLPRHLAHRHALRAR